jgi:hypothetical protein
MVGVVYGSRIMGLKLRGRGDVQGPRQQGTSNDVQPAGDTGEPEKQSTRISPNVLGPVAAAFITAASSLLIFSFNQINRIDARLDELEKEARLLLAPDGSASPSKQALDAYYGIESMKERLSFIEERLHFHGK